MGKETQREDRRIESSTNSIYIICEKLKFPDETEKAARRRKKKKSHKRRKLDESGEKKLNAIDCYLKFSYFIGTPDRREWGKKKGQEAGMQRDKEARYNNMAFTFNRLRCF